MNIEDLTLKQIREIQSLFVGASCQPAQQSTYYHRLVGKNVILRTVTMILTRKLVEVTDSDLVLIDASWIARTERYMKFVAEGAVTACEPYPDGLHVPVSRGSLVDGCELKKELPRSQK